MLPFLFPLRDPVCLSPSGITTNRPDPERVSVKGSLFSIHIGSSYLLRPGNYSVHVFKSGYKPLELPLLVTGESNQKLVAVMEKLPGRLTVTAYSQERPAETVEGAQVIIDGEKAGVTPLAGIEVKAGPREVLVRADQYQDFKTSLEVEGMGALQTINAALVSASGGITVDSIPSGADIAIDGTVRGKTPLQLKLGAGTYGLEISAPHYKSWQSRIEVKEGQQEVLGTVTLLPADGTIKLLTNPPGAIVTVDKTFVGQTPARIPLSPELITRFTSPRRAMKKLKKRCVWPAKRSGNSVWRWNPPSGPSTSA